MKKTLKITTCLYIISIILNCLSEPKYVLKNHGFKSNNGNMTAYGVIIKDYENYNKKYTYEHTEITNSMSVTPKGVFENKWNSKEYKYDYKILDNILGFLGALLGVHILLWMFKDEKKNTEP